MIKRARNLRRDVLFSCEHHAFPDRLTVEVVKLDDCIGIVTSDKLAKRSWRQRISIVAFSVFMQTYYYDSALLWSLLARGVAFNGYDIEYSTEHLQLFPRRQSSLGVDAVLVWKTTKRTLEHEFWFIDALVETHYPFTLEFNISKFSGDSYRYVCRVEPSSIMHLFEQHCLQFLRKQQEHARDALGSYPPLENGMLQAIVDDMYYDADSSSFRIRFIELSSLESYLDDSLHKNHFEDRAAPIPRGDNRMHIPAEPTYTPTDSEDEDAMHAAPAHSAAVASYSAASVSDMPSLSTEERRPSSQMVPDLLDQMHRTHSLHRRPPTIDHARTDTEIDALASQVISELDLASLAEDSTAPSSLRRSPAVLEDDGSYALRDMHVPLHPTGSAHPATTMQSDHGVAMREAEEDLERSSAMMLLLQKMKSTKEDSNPRARVAFLMKPGESPLLAGRVRSLRPQDVTEVAHVANDGDDDGGSFGDDGFLPSDSDDPSREESDPEVADGSAAPPLAQAPALGLSERTALRTDMAKKFRESKFATMPAVNKSRAHDKIEMVVRQSKALAKRALLEETLELVDPYSELNSKPRGPVTLDLRDVHEALATKASIRSRQSQGVIFDFFRYGCKLSAQLERCGKQDLLELSNLAELRVLMPMARSSEPLHVVGEPILTIYIVLEGQIAITEYATSKAQTSHAPSSSSASAPKLGRVRLLAAGDCFGENVLKGELDWTVDIAMPEAPLTVCCLPLDAVLRYIGRRGEEVEGALVLFWKHHRLWQEIKQHRHDLLRHAKYKQQLKTSHAAARERIQFNFQQMDVISAGRIKVFQPGMDIFAQGHPREFLYLVLRGCVEYRRVFPAFLVKEGIMPPSVEVGLSLMCGDFSFMDGEDHLWLEKMNEHDDIVTKSAEDSDLMREHRKNKYVRFDAHKNSLVAVSRAEVALVPIAEIAKCMKLFMRLIKLATELYPAPFVGDEDLVRRHYEEVKWQGERGEVLRQVAQEREARMLNEIWFQDPDNNISDEMYRARKPGYRVAKLDQSLASSSASAVLQSGKAPPHSARSASKAPVTARAEAAEHERLLLQAMVDLHTPRRAKMDRYFQSFTKPAAALAAVGAESAKSDAYWETSDSARTPGRRSPQSRVSPGRRGSVALDPPISSPGGEQGPETGAFPAAHARPRSAAPVMSHRRPPSAPLPETAHRSPRSPRPFSAAEIQRTAKVPPTLPQRPQSSGISQTTTASPRPHSAGSKRGTCAPPPSKISPGRSRRPATAGSDERSRAHSHRPGAAASEADASDKNPAAAQVRLSHAGGSEKLGFVVDDAFLAQFNTHTPEEDQIAYSPHSPNMSGPGFGPSTPRVPDLALRPSTQLTGVSARGLRGQHPPSATARCYQSEAAKRQVLDPEQYVQLYRDRLHSTDPKSVFVNEFIRRPFL